MTWGKREFYKKSGIVRMPTQIERFWQVLPPAYSETVPPLYVVKTGYSIWTRGKVTKRESYNSLGIEMVTAGDLVFDQDGSDHLVRPGSIFLKRPGHRHSYKTGPSGMLHKRFIDFNGPGLDLLLNNLNLTGVCTVAIPNPMKFKQYFRDAIRILCQGGPEMHFDLAALGYRMMLSVADGSLAANIPAEVSEVIADMKRRLHEDVKTTVFAENAHISPARLYRLFEHFVGESPARYFRNMKMNHAKDLLLYSNRSIKVIAYSLGYNDPFAFSTAFHKSTGLSPTDMRKHSIRDYK